MLDPDAWQTTIPAELAVVHVDTTGPRDDDRIVAVACLRLRSAALQDGDFDLDYCHLVCDPGKASAPAAVRAHGFSDWDLRHQEPFAASAPAIASLLAPAHMVVAMGHGAHDALRREFRAAGEALPNRPWTDAAPSSVAVFGDIDLPLLADALRLNRPTVRPGPLVDAWVLLLATLSVAGCRLRFPFSDFPEHRPTNWRPAPPKPPGRLPRRKPIPPLLPQG